MKKWWILGSVIIILILIIPISRMLETQYIKKHLVLDKTSNKFILPPSKTLSYLGDQLGTFYDIVIVMPSFARACAAKGGNVTPYDQACGMPFTDAGKQCHDSSECKGSCVPDQPTKNKSPEALDQLRYRAIDDTKSLFHCGAECTGTCSVYDNGDEYNDYSLIDNYFIKNGDVYPVIRFVH